MLLKLRNCLNLNFKAQFSTTSSLLRRKPPKEELENNLTGRRRTTLDPYDRRWRWTPKSAEPYNKYGGDIRWTKLPFLRRGVQIPGYVDPKTERFIFVEEMVPEIIAPNLTDCKLKPYVPYNVTEITEPVMTPKRLFTEIYEEKIKREFESAKLQTAKKSESEVESKPLSS